MANLEFAGADTFEFAAADPFELGADAATVEVTGSWHWLGAAHNPDVAGAPWQWTHTLETWLSFGMASGYQDMNVGVVTVNPGEAAGYQDENVGLTPSRWRVNEWPIYGTTRDACGYQDHNVTA